MSFKFLIVLVHLTYNHCLTIYISFFIQGVLKIRKRVTLMAVIVSVIFGVCWLTDSCMYALNYIVSPYSDVAYAIASIMILFNSAVNPFVYALVNQRFRQKIKGMLGCNCFSSIKIRSIDILEV